MSAPVGGANEPRIVSPDGETVTDSREETTDDRDEDSERSESVTSAEQGGQQDTREEQTGQSIGRVGEGLGFEQAADGTVRGPNAADRRTLREREAAEERVRVEEGLGFERAADGTVRSPDSPDRRTLRERETAEESVRVEEGLGFERAADGTVRAPDSPDRETLRQERASAQPAQEQIVPDGTRPGPGGELIVSQPRDEPEGRLETAGRWFSENISEPFGESVGDQVERTGVAEVGRRVGVDVRGFSEGVGFGAAEMLNLPGHVAMGRDAASFSAEQFQTGVTPVTADVGPATLPIGLAADPEGFDEAREDTTETTGQLAGGLARSASAEPARFTGTLVGGGIGGVGAFRAAGAAARSARGSRFARMDFDEFVQADRGMMQGGRQRRRRDETGRSDIDRTGETVLERDSRIGELARQQQEQQIFEQRSRFGQFEQRQVPEPGRRFDPVDTGAQDIRAGVSGRGGPETATGDLSFQANFDAAIAARQATPASALERGLAAPAGVVGAVPPDQRGPQQPNPGGLLFDERGELRGEDTLVPAEEFLDITGARADSESAVMSAEARETGVDEVEELFSVQDRPAGMLDTDTGTTTQEESLSDTMTRERPATRPGSAGDTATRPGVTTAVTTRPGARPATRVQPRVARTLGIGATAAFTTPTTTRPIARPTRTPFIPTPRRGGGIEFDTFGRVDDEPSGVDVSVGESDTRRGPGWFGETLEAFGGATLGTDRAVLPDTFDDDDDVFAGDELPTLGVLEPEEGTQDAADLFGVDLGGAR